MAANIGELFKTLGNNPDFFNYIINGNNNNKSVLQIIDDVIADESLMNILIALVADISVIRLKMEIAINQKIKGLKTKKEKEISLTISEKDSEKDLEDVRQKNMENGDLDEQHMQELVEHLEELEKEELEKEELEKELDPFAHMLHKPVDASKVVWLWRTCYMEQVGMTMRLINNDLEMFY